MSPDGDGSWPRGNPSGLPVPRLPSPGHRRSVGSFTPICAEVPFDWNLVCPTPSEVGELGHREDIGNVRGLFEQSLAPQRAQEDLQRSRGRAIILAIRCSLIRRCPERFFPLPVQPRPASQYAAAPTGVERVRAFTLEDSDANPVHLGQLILRCAEHGPEDPQPGPPAQGRAFWGPLQPDPKGGTDPSSTALGGAQKRR